MRILEQLYKYNIKNISFASECLRPLYTALALISIGTNAIAAPVSPCGCGTGSPRTTSCRPRPGLPLGSAVAPFLICRVDALLLAAIKNR